MTPCDGRSRLGEAPTSAIVRDSRRISAGVRAIGTKAILNRVSDLLLVPAAFALATGKDHWELLLRARAVENQCYVLAANQSGPSDPPGWVSCGRSMVVDPWGVVVAQA